MRRDTWVQVLPCELNEVERDERARAGMATIRQLELLKEEHSVRAAEMGAARKELEKKVRALAVAAETGREERPISCYESANLATFRVEIIRMDTGEVFDAREMDENERKKARQRGFEFSPEIVAAAEAERKAQANRKKVTELKGWERRREVNRMDAERERGIEHAPPPIAPKHPNPYDEFANEQRAYDEFANELLGDEQRAKRQTDRAPPAFLRDPDAKHGSMENPRDLPSPMNYDDEPEPPGADIEEEERTESDPPEAELGSVDNPRPIGPPPQGDRH